MQHDGKRGRKRYLTENSGGDRSDKGEEVQGVIREKFSVSLREKSMREDREL